MNILFEAINNRSAGINLINFFDKSFIIFMRNNRNRDFPVFQFNGSINAR